MSWLIGPLTNGGQVSENSTCNIELAWRILLTGMPECRVGACSALSFKKTGNNIPNHLVCEEAMAQVEDTTKVPSENLPDVATPGWLSYDSKSMRRAPLILRLHKTTPINHSGFNIDSCRSGRCQLRWIAGGYRLGIS